MKTKGYLEKREAELGVEEKRGLEEGSPKTRVYAIRNSFVICLFLKLIKMKPPIIYRKKKGEIPASLPSYSIFVLHFLDYLSNKLKFGVENVTINTEKGQNSQESLRIWGET